MPTTRLTWLLGIALACAATAASCGDSGESNSPSPSTGAQTGAGAQGGSGAQAGAGGLIITGGSGGGQQQGFDVQPQSDQTLSVLIGQTTPTATYTATLNGDPISAGWGLDKGNVGTIDPGPSSSATLAPSGKAGGVVTISAGLNGQVLKRKVLVQLHGEQNGPNSSAAELAQIASTVADLTAGGGVGGVGGEGLGQQATDAPTLSALASPSGDGSAQGLQLLYPYDATVWPRGLPAPLLQWDWSSGDADAIQIELSTATASFSWKGTFSRPAILAQTGGKFIRHPIPQDIWDMATNSAGGLSDPLTVKLTVALGGQAYGPITETWTVAPARLAGIIYYNSYGTELAKNYAGAIGGGDGMFGGAVLSIHVGDTGPKLVAGGNSATPGTSDPTKCRVCHSVAADGSRLVVAHGENYNALSSFDLSPNGTTEQAWVTPSTYFPGVSADGSLALASSGQLVSLPTATGVSSTGLPAAALGMPAFSPDGTHVAFNPNASNQLVVMAFDGTSTFSAQTVVVDDSTMPGWPAFFPDGNSVVFEREVAAGGDGHGASLLWTRGGAKGRIAWTGATDATQTTVLNRLNGLDGNGDSYLPKLATPGSMSCQWTTGQPVGQIDPDHGDDTNLNYEPTVNPVASGGYAWVVFTSRRMYGNVATIAPFCSDPRWADLVHNITPKKLWVAAVDLSGQLGTDPSHPSFYLPAQEILAGNSRGFWTLDPCRPNGTSCETGDQCCNGYCEPNGDGGALDCSDKPPDSNCSGLQEKCTLAADCCDTTNVCINGFCSLEGPA